MWYKNIRAQNFLILAFALLGIAGSLYIFTLQWELTTDERQQIESTVFSSLVDYLTYHPQVETDYIFIGISGSDPSPQILQNFRSHIIAVEPLSSSRKSFGFSAPVVHKSDMNKRGISIELLSLEKQSNGNINVLISLYQDRAAAARYKYILDKRDGTYRVKHVTFPDRDVF